MKKFPFQKTALAVALLTVPLSLHAHPGHGPESGFSSGLTHPLFGLDHLAAMVAVGIWAAQLGGRARWMIPTAFVATMALGAFAGTHGYIIAGLEQSIAASVLVLGLLIALSAKLPISVSIVIVSLFAMFHGLAHGAELPPTANGLLFGFGFAMATAALHLVGLLIGSRFSQKSATISKLTGAVIVALGATLLLT